MNKNIFKDKLEDSIFSNPSFDKINNQISYSQLIKQKRKRINVKTCFSLICILIISISALTFLTPKKEKILSYNDILNSNDFVYSKGASSSFLSHFERSVDMQFKKNDPVQFYKIQTHDLDELYTCAYIPSNYYEKYYNFFNKNQDEDYIYNTNILEAYLKDVKIEKIDSELIWVEYNSLQEIKTSVDNLKLVSILRSRFIDILSNESKNINLHLKKRLYINFYFSIENNKIVFKNINFDTELCNINGTYLFALPKSSVENKNKAFAFSTYFYFYGIYKLGEYNNKSALYIESNNIEEIYYGKYYSRIMNTKISTYTNEANTKYNIFDYKEFSKIIYK